MATTSGVSPTSLALSLNVPDVLLLCPGSLLVAPFPSYNIAEHRRTSEIRGIVGRVRKSLKLVLTVHQVNLGPPARIEPKKARSVVVSPAPDLPNKPRPKTFQNQVKPFCKNSVKEHAEEITKKSRPSAYRSEASSG